MTLDDYKAELSESLYFGPWCDGFNPGKAQTLVRMAEMELDEESLAELYCYYTYCCFDSSVRWGEERREYYETATGMFEKMVAVVDKQETDGLFKKMEPLVQKTIDVASKATGYASGYDWYLDEQWWRSKWYPEEE